MIELRVFLYLFLLVFLTLGSAVANAQATNPIVIQTCGSPPNQLQPGNPSPGYTDVNGNKCSSSKTTYTPMPNSLQTITVSGTAQGLTVPTGATGATLSVTTGNVLYRDDGTAPTATVGTTLYSGTSPYWYTGNLSAIQFILPSGVGSATITVGFYK